MSESYRVILQGGTRLAVPEQTWSPCTVGGGVCSSDERGKGVDDFGAGEGKEGRKKKVRRVKGETVPNSLAARKRKKDPFQCIWKEVYPSAKKRKKK